jgi:hypothetical protein
VTALEQHWQAPEFAEDAMTEVKSLFGGPHPEPPLGSRLAMRCRVADLHPTPPLHRPLVENIERQERSRIDSSQGTGIVSGKEAI